VLIKINGVPWHDVQDPDDDDDLREIAEDFFKNDHTVYPLEQLLDRFNYLIMKQTPVTKELYNASSWVADKILGTEYEIFDHVKEWIL
jgi:hypothetical protein